MRLLTKLRYEAGLETAELAAKAGLPPNLVSFCEFHDLVLADDQIAALANALGFEGVPERLYDEVDGPDNGVLFVPTARGKLDSE